ncbi:MAG: hypothetical protein WCH46_10590 [bacterium]
MYKIYCDFDATVTVNDVWDKLFKEFGDPYAFKVWEKFNTGEFTAAQCIAAACETVQAADPLMLEKMFLAEPIRPGFIQFIEFCKLKSLPISIVSDGFSMYIRTMFAHNLIDLPYYANTVEVNNLGRLDATFPLMRESWRYSAAC